jgi:hypothetical protein
MHLHSLLNRKRVKTNPHQRNPSSIIFDAEEALATFYRETKNLRYSELYLDEIINNILIYISSRDNLELGLISLRKDIEAAHAIDVGWYRDRGEEMPDAVVKLARSLHQIFCVLGLFNHNGLLLYEYGGLADKNSIILKQIHCPF